MPYPLMFRLGQELHGPRINDVPSAVAAELSKLSLENKVRPGHQVAITCGSRPIAQYPSVVKADRYDFQLHRRRLQCNGAKAKRSRRYGRGISADPNDRVPRPASEIPR